MSSPITGHYWEEFGSLLFIAFHHLFADMTKNPLSLLCCRLRSSQLFQPFLVWQMLQSLYPLCGSVLESVQYVCSLPVLGSPVLDSAFQMCLTRAEKGGRITSLDLLATLFLTQPRRLVAFLAKWVHCWVMVKLSTRTPRSFSAELLPSSSFPSL